MADYVDWKSCRKSPGCFAKHFIFPKAEHLCTKSLNKVLVYFSHSCKYMCTRVRLPFVGYIISSPRRTAPGGFFFYSLFFSLLLLLCAGKKDCVGHTCTETERDQFFVRRREEGIGLALMWEPRGEKIHHALTASSHTKME